MHSDTTITPDNLSSVSDAEDTSQPLILNVTSLSDAIEAPVSDLQPEVTLIGEPTTQVNQVTLTAEPTTQMNQVTLTGEPTAQMNQVTLTGEPTAQMNQVTLTGEPTTQLNQVTLPGGPTAQVNYAAVTANPLELGCPMQDFDDQAQDDLEACMSDGSTLSIVGIDVHTTTALA